MRSTDIFPHHIDVDRMVSRHVREAAVRAHEQFSGVMPSQVTAFERAVNAGIVSGGPACPVETIPAAAIDRMRSAHNEMMDRCIVAMQESLRHG